MKQYQIILRFEFTSIFDSNLNLKIYAPLKFDHNQLILEPTPNKSASDQT